MAEELRWVLIIISVVVIGGLLIHGLWSVRKKDAPMPSHSERVEPSESVAAVHDSEPKTEPMMQERDEPQFGDINFSAEDEHNDPLVSQADANSDGEAVKEHNDTASDATNTADESSAEVNDAPEPAQPSDFIIVHIQMPDGLTMEGSKLLPAVNTLGFKYSEEGFFNRHLDPAGHGPVLFRLVNMYNPGTFDVDNMEQFSTAGVSLFMTLPCDGDGLSAFNMLHSAAKKLADEFGATILDTKRQEMSVDSVREYVEKVRSFSV
ncbi:cell division protein ZipA [Pseudoalteromonas sp.]|uniref:cell division protein ZipA n=1 Tax=unclassified Pseudoalteromonas TaxID=194690 RepID=UPI003F98D11B